MNASPVIPEERREVFHRIRNQGFVVDVQKNLLPSGHTITHVGQHKEYGQIGTLRIKTVRIKKDPDHLLVGYYDLEDFIASFSGFHPPLEGGRSLLLHPNIGIEIFRRYMDSGFTIPARYMTDHRHQPALIIFAQCAFQAEVGGLFWYAWSAKDREWSEIQIFLPPGSGSEYEWKEVLS